MFIVQQMTKDTTNTVRTKRIKPCTGWNECRTFCRKISEGERNGRSDCDFLEACIREEY